MEQYNIKKELNKFIKDRLSKGHSLSSIHKDLIKCGYENYADELIRTHRVKNSITVIVPLLTLVLLAFSLFFFNVGITSFIILGKQIDYSDNVNLNFEVSSEYIWIPEHQGTIKSLRLSGSYETEGNVKVYLEDEGVRYLIFDSSKLNENDLSGITGLVVSDKNNKTKKQETNETSNEKDKPAKPEPNTPPVWKSDVNEFVIDGKTTIDLNGYFFDKNNDVISYTSTTPDKISVEINNNLITLTPAENNFNTTIAFTASDGLKSTTKEATLIVPERKIAINLEYKKDTVYDSDNDGIEDTTGIIDLTVENTQFNWDVNEDNLCTRYEIYSIGNKGSTFVCFGNSDCCAFADLKSSRNEWNDELLLTYGLYDTALNNIISSQVIYVDINLSIDNLYSDIFYSEWQELPVKFQEEFASFDNICTETCILSVNKPNYKLIIEINNSILKLDSINYIIERTEENNPPILIKNISDFKLTKKSLTIDLSEYFEDLDQDILSFNNYGIENVNVVIENDIATIIPDEGFEGTVYLFFTAEDSFETTNSNVFSITITKPIKEAINRSRVVINEPVKWTKNFKFDAIGTATVNITSYATDITVRKVENNIAKDILKENIKIKYRGKIKGLTEYEIEKRLEKTEEGKIKVSEDIDELTEVIIEDLVEEVEIEYFTEGPSSEEIEISSNRKRIIISSDMHYKDILAFTNLPIEANSEAIKLFWLVNDTRIEVPTDKFDTNGNDLIDYIEWNVPSLSNQTYELVIEITKAEHLDENRVLVEDIFDLVKARDNIWTNEIPASHYIRVTFEQSLTNDKDITLYARSTVGASIEVYEKDQNNLIAVFDTINEDNKYQIFLTNLIGTQDTFDLKIINNPIEFDYIVDPDIILPIINGTLNKSTTNILQGDVINATFNATDEINLTNGTIVINSTGFNRYFNFSLNGSGLITLQFSQNFTISEAAGTVINITGIVRDNSSNVAQNETIITVTAIPSLLVNINAPLNNTNVTQNTLFNLTVNVTCLNADCGIVKGVARYNDSGSVPNKSISIAQGATPLFVNGTDGVQIWSYTYDGGGGDIAYDVAVDSSDNIIVVGRHGSNTDWNVTKLDSDGVQIWSYTYDGGGTDIAFGVAVDSSDNIIVVGRHGSDIDWNVTKLDSDGNQLWSYTYEDGSTDIAYGVAVDSSDNIIVVGRHKSTQDWNVTKLDSDGNQLWSYTYDSGSTDIAYGVAVDSSDNIIVVGHRPLISADWNVTKLDSSNTAPNQLWSFIYDSGAIDEAYDVAVDSSDNIIVVGKHKSSTDWNVIKLDSDGNQVWSNTFDGGGGGADIVNDVAVDSSDNIIVVGGTSSEWRVIKFESDGNELWSYTYDDDNDAAFGVAVDLSDNIIVVGHHGSGNDWNVTKLESNLNPFSCGNMKQNDVCQLNFTINASGGANVFALDVNFSSVNNSKVVDNDTEDHLIEIIVPPEPVVPPLAQGRNLINRSNAFVIFDVDDLENDEFGQAVATGDFNNDGIDDVIIGARFAEGENFDSGKAYIYFGDSSGIFLSRPGPDVILLDPDDTANDKFGQAVAVGDFNNDGFDDALIGAYLADGGASGTGKAYIYFGAASDMASGKNANITFLDPDDVADDRFGQAVASGDFNNDGFDDALIGANRADGGNTNTGKVYIYFGAASDMANGTNASVTFLDPDDVASDNFGNAVASGDFNNDSFDDALIGANLADGGNSGTGKAYIYFGASNMTNGTGSNSTGVNVTFLDPDDVASDNFGQAVASGDFNNDGFDDALIGANSADGGSSNTGKAYIYFGAISDMANGTIANVTFLDPDDVASDNFGNAVASGNFNNDSFDDALIGANLADGGNSGTGKAYIYFGASNMTNGTGSNSTSVNVTFLDPDDAASDEFGQAVASGDFNNDGFDDALIGAYLAEGGSSNTGKAYIYFMGNTFYDYFPKLSNNGTSSTLFEIYTYLNSTCKYSTSSGIDFSSMTFMNTTDGLNHTINVTNLNDGDVNIYHIKCYNNISNFESKEMTIAFGVAETEHTYAVNHSFQWACEKTGTFANPTSASDCTSLATATDYTNINSEDDTRWVTSGTDTDFLVESQIFTFNISNVSTRVKFYWQGYGFTSAQTADTYGTSIAVWNFNQSIWEVKDSNMFTSAADGELTMELTDLADNLNSTGQIVFLVSHLHFKAACFLAGTRISMADGSYKNIEDIEEGDYVVSHNEDNKNKIITRVTETVKHPSTDFADYYLIINKKIRVTPNHPLYINGKWREAGTLKVGEYLQSENNQKVKVENIEKVYDEVDTYNFEVESSANSDLCGAGHNYYADGILAHNKRCAYLFSITDEGEYFEDVTLGVFEEPGNVNSLQINDRMFQENEGYSYLNLDKHNNKFVLRIPPHEIDYIDHLYLKVIDTLDKFSLLGLPKEKVYHLSLVNSSEGYELLVKEDGRRFALDGETRYPHVLNLTFEELPEKDEKYQRIVQFVEKGYYEPFEGSGIWYDFAPFNQTKWRNWLDKNDNERMLAIMLNNLLYNHSKIGGNHSPLFEKKMAGFFPDSFQEYNPPIQTKDIANSLYSSEDMAPEVLFSSDSKYGYIDVIDDEYKGRELFIDYIHWCSTNSDVLTFINTVLNHLNRNSDVLHIGLGCGLMSGEIAENEKVESLDVLEMNPVVVEAAEFFSEFNHDLLNHKKVNLVIDGESDYIFTSKKKYDSIIMNIQNPIISHTSSFYTVEYFKAMESLLNENGVFGLWHGWMGEVDYDYLKIMYKSLREAFDYVYYVEENLIIVASNSPLDERELGLTYKDLDILERLEVDDAYQLNTLNNKVLQNYAGSVRSTYDLLRDKQIRNNNKLDSGDGNPVDDIENKNKLNKGFLIILLIIIFLIILSKYGLKKKLSRKTIVFAIALSGSAALIYEVAATQALMFFFVSSTYSVATVLSSFLFGLAIGSLLMSKYIQKIKNKQNFFVALQFLIGAYALFVLSHFELIPKILLLLEGFIGESRALLILVKFLIAGSYLLVPTLLLGASFPLAFSLIVSSAKKAGKELGILYSWDIFGAIFGSLIAGFLLLPLYGLKAAFFFGAILSFFSGFLVMRKNKITVLSIALVILFAFALYPQPTESPVISGNTVTVSDYSLPVGVLFSSNSAYGKVDVFKDENNDVTLYIDYIEQCSSSWTDLNKGFLNAELEQLNDDSDVLNIGLGCGLMAGEIAENEKVINVDVIEINQVVAEAAEYFSSFNHDALNHRKISLTIDDGAHYLSTSNKKYDAIIIDIQNPIIVHSSPLYTVEYFKIMSSSLKENGILGMWSGWNGEVDYDYIKTLYKSLKVAFEYVYYVKEHSLVIASNYPLQIDKLSMTQVDLELLQRLESDNNYELNTLNHGVLEKYGEPVRLFYSSLREKNKKIILKTNEKDKGNHNSLNTDYVYLMSTTASFTVAVTPSPVPSPGPSLVSTTGPSTSSAASLIPETIEESTYSHFYTSIESGKEIELNINRKGLAVTKVAFELNQKLNDVSFSIIIVQNPSNSIDNAYQYFEIESDIIDITVVSSTIYFKVRKDSGYIKETITLNKYKSGWNKLPTSFVKEDNNFYYYESNSNGFSLFAITGEKPIVEEEIIEGEIGAGKIIEIKIPTIEKKIQIPREIFLVLLITFLLFSFILLLISFHRSYGYDNFIYKSTNPFRIFYKPLFSNIKHVKDFTKKRKIKKTRKKHKF